MKKVIFFVFIVGISNNILPMILPSLLSRTPRFNLLAQNRIRIKNKISKPNYLVKIGYLSNSTFERNNQLKSDSKALKYLMTIPFFSKKNEIKENKNYSNDKLIEAIRSENLDQVEYLIKEGADVNAKDNDGNTALMIAVLHKIELVKYLIQAGADVNIKSNCHHTRGCTALMYATLRGNLEIVKYLIQAGADVNVKNNNGLTALMYAAQYQPEVVKYLILEEANLNQIKHRANEYHTEIKIKKKQKDLLNLLTNYKKNRDRILELVNWFKEQSLLDLLRDYNGNTLLHHAIANNDKVTAFRLIENYPSLIEVKNKNGQTPIDSRR